MKTKTTSIFMLAIVAACLVSCKNNQKKDMAKNDEQQHHGLDLEYMDTTVSPKQDFYNYVNGTWMKETEIPGDHKSWGSFQNLRKTTDHNVLVMIDSLESNNDYASDSDQAKALDIYQTKLDTAARKKAGISPIEPILKKIDAISDMEDLQKTMAEYPL